MPISFINMIHYINFRNNRDKLMEMIEDQDLNNSIKKFEKI